MILSSWPRDLLSRKAPKKKASRPNLQAGHLPLFRAKWAMSHSDPTTSRFPVLGVGAVIWNANREVVLIRRGKAPRENQWSIPGGHVEWGESVPDALLREVREETGLSIEIAGLIDVVDLMSQDDAGNVTRHYVLIDLAARWKSGNLLAGSDAAEARWVSYSELANYALWSETRRIIDASLTLIENNGG